ncbi:hypothetical protein D3C84_1134080 [compost metagenome]
MPEGQRLAWFDRQLPQRQFAFLAQGRAEEVRLAHRDPTSGEDQVNVCQPGQGLAGQLQVVGEDAGIHHRAA